MRHSYRTIITWTAVIVTATIVVLYAFFCHQYRSYTWFADAPPELHVGGRDFHRSLFEPFASIPRMGPTDPLQWYPKHHMWPLGYDIFWPRGYPVTTGVYLHWRDGLFYSYALEGGP